MNSQEYYLNIRPGEGYPQTVKVSQGDVGRPLLFHLMDGVTPLTIAAGSDVVIHATKPSGLGFTESCTVTGSAVSVSSTIDMTQEFGLFPAEIVVTLNDEVLATANFSILVERSPHPEGTTDGVAEDLQDIYEQLDDLKNDIGDLSYLETTDKSNLVAAINEAAQSGGSGDGLTDDIKVSLLQVAAHTIYDDTHGQDYYDDLESVLYPTATLSSISAVYTQPGTVYDTEILDSLKNNLVVTAHYSDNTTRILPKVSYTLNGTLAVGTDTITVSYGGKSTTFTVTVTKYWDFEWDYTQGKLEELTDWQAETSGTVSSTMVSDGQKLTAASSSYIELYPLGNGVDAALRLMPNGYGTLEVECYGTYNNNGNNLRITAAKDTTNRVTLQSYDKKWRLMKNTTVSSSANTVIADAPANTIQTIRILLKNTTADIFVNGVKVASDIVTTGFSSGTINNLMFQNGGTASSNYEVIRAYRIRLGAE